MIFIAIMAVFQDRLYRMPFVSNAELGQLEASGSLFVTARNGGTSGRICSTPQKPHPAVFQATVRVQFLARTVQLQRTKR